MPNEATLKIEPLRQGGGTVRQIHAMAYSQGIADVLSDLVANCNNPSVLRRMCKWVFGQLKLTSRQRARYIDALRDTKVVNFLDTIRSLHCPYDGVGVVGAERDLLVGDAAYLISAQAEIEKKFGKDLMKKRGYFVDCKTVLKKLFNYESFCKGSQLLYVKGGGGEFRWSGKLAGVLEGWGAWEFVHRLNVRYCPYCNAETVYAVKFDTKSVKDPDREVLIRSALDHFFPHSECPYFGISLYNLVPTCYRCNSQIKGSRKPEAETFAHPYLHDVYDGFRFRLTKLKDPRRFALADTEDDFEIEVTSTKKAEAPKVRALMCDLFRIPDVYAQLFKPEAFDIARRIRLFTPAYKTLLRKRKLCGITLNRALFGCELDSKRITQYRHAKLTIDLNRQFRAS